MSECARLIDLHCDVCNAGFFESGSSPRRGACNCTCQLLCLCSKQYGEQIRTQNFGFKLYKCNANFMLSEKRTMPDSDRDDLVPDLVLSIPRTVPASNALRAPHWLEVLSLHLWWTFVDLSGCAAVRYEFLVGVSAFYLSDIRFDTMMLHLSMSVARLLNWAHFEGMLQ